MSHAKAGRPEILAHLKKSADQTRQQIGTALAIEPIRLSNLLASLKADGLVVCEFFGRHSKWSLKTEGPAAQMPANSVFNMAAHQ